MAPHTSRKKTNSAGFTLVEVGIVSVLSAMLMSSAMMFISDYLKGQGAQSLGQELFALNQAVNSYESKYSVQLANNQPIAIPGYANVANIYSPTTAELFELGVLPNSTPQGNYGVKIGSSLVGGVPSGVVWNSQPFLNNDGAVDISLAGDALLAAGGDAGYSTPTTPALIQGADGWTLPNPTGNTVGILAMRNGAGSGAYLRLDGSTPMQGSINMNSNSVNNANLVNAQTLTATTTNTGTLAASGNITGSGSLSVSGPVTAGGAITASSTVKGTTLTATATGNGVMFGSSALYSDGTNTAIRQNGTVYLTNMTGSSYSGLVAGTVAAQGDVAAQGTLQISGVVASGNGCYPNGAIARDTPGNVLSCLNGVWTTPNAQDLANLGASISNVLATLNGDTAGLQNQLNSLSGSAASLQAQINGLSGTINSIQSSAGSSDFAVASAISSNGGGSSTSYVGICSPSPNLGTPRVTNANQATGGCGNSGQLLGNSVNANVCGGYYAICPSNMPYYYVISTTQNAGYSAN